MTEQNGENLICDNLQYYKKISLVSCAALCHTLNACPTLIFYYDAAMRATFLGTIGTFALKAKFASNIFQIPLILLPPICFVHPTRNIYVTLFKSWFVRPVIVNWIANHHIQVSKQKKRGGGGGGRSKIPFFYPLVTYVCIYNILESKLFMNLNYESSLSITIKWQKDTYRLMRDLNENECNEIHTHTNGCPSNKIRKQPSVVFCGYKNCLQCIG